MVKVLLDHNMPPRIARALHQIIACDGHESFALRDKFPVNITDVEYFDVLGKERDWIVISKDLHNGKRAPERAAILRNKILAFYLSPAMQKQKVHQQTASILWQWENILAQKALNESGLFQLPQNKGSKFRPL